MQIRPNTDSDTVVLELSTTNGRITLGGAAGTIELSIAYTDTATLDPQRAVYDLVLTDPSGVPKTLFGGSVNIIKTRTR